MPGFFISNLAVECDLHNYDDMRCRRDQKKLDEWIIKRNTLNKFMDDKIFHETDEYFVLLEGAIYNFRKLQEMHGCVDYWHTVLKLIHKECFFEKFRGSFSGAVYDKKKKKWTVFTGQLGEKAIFYYVKDNFLIVGSQLNYVTDCMKVNGIARIPDAVAMNQFMAFGYYLDESTCIKDVKRLYPGEYMEFYADGRFEVKTYYKADYVQDLNTTEEEILECYHDTFLHAMYAILKKNEEYGYKNLLDISGGADSRMICYAAKELHADRVLLDCYGQSTCSDAKIAARIANKLGYEYVFRSLDNADCMMHIDDNILMNNGATIYCGITGGKSMLEMFDRDTFGLECTGLLGDVDEGSMVITYCDGHIDKNYLRFRNSTTLEFGKDFVFPEKVEKRFANHQNEHYWFYTRGMIFGMTSYFIRQNFVEVATPFGDLDFLNVYLRTPWEKRVKEFLLRKWMIEYYPQAADIPYAATGVSIKRSISGAGKIEAYLKANLRHFIHKRMPDKPYGMNDFGYWYRSNPEFREYLDGYCRENYNYCEEYEEIKYNLDKLLCSGLIMDKLIAVSVLSIIKIYLK